MFVSYSQNFEDVLLWRAVGHVEGGFYIDVGAQEPDVFSVSRAFYEHGWRGVHIEPVAHYARKLRAARPDEVVIEAAIAEREGTIEFYEISGTGLSTGRSEIAGRHSEAGFPSTRTQVPSLRLGSLLDRYAARDIHWLKIDVEEMEAEVIASWSPSEVRPWVVVVESTAPLSQEPTFAEWEPLLIEMNYRFAHFDGLNRFYVHAAHLELLDRLKLGPNVFDGFVVGEGSPYAQMLGTRIEEFEEQLAAVQSAVAEERAPIVAAMEHAKSALSDSATKDERIRARTAELAELQRKLGQSQMLHAAQLAGLKSQLAILNDHVAHQDRSLSQKSSKIIEQQTKLQAMFASNSWRVTAPLRWLKLAWLRVSRAESRASLRTAIVGTVRLAAGMPIVAFHGRRLLRRVPRVESWLRHLLHSGGKQPSQVVRALSSPEDLPPRTLKIYRAIKTARSSRDLTA